MSPVFSEFEGGIRRSSMAAPRSSPGHDIGDFRRDAPDLGPSSKSGGLLDSFEAEFAADPQQRWMDKTRAFGGGPQAPTIAEEETEQRRQFEAMDYEHEGRRVSSRRAGNWPMTQWQSLARNTGKTPMPAVLAEAEPSVQLDAIDVLRENPHITQLRDQYSEQSESDAGDDRGMLDDFDAEFTSGAPLDDANLDEKEVRAREAQRKVDNPLAPTLGAKAPRRESGYGRTYNGGLYPKEALPARSLQREAKERQKVYQSLKYKDGGKVLKPGDPRTRGRLQEAPAKKPGIFSRMGTRISNWWRGSKLNWSNWGRGSRRQAG